MLSGARSLDVVINSHHAALNIADDSQILDSLSTKLGLVLTQAPTSDGWQLAGSAFVGRTSHDGTRGKVLDNLAETGMRSLTSEFSSNDAVLAISANYSTELSKTMRFEGGLEGRACIATLAHGISARGLEQSTRLAGLLDQGSKGLARVWAEQLIVSVCIIQETEKEG